MTSAALLDIDAAPTANARTPLPAQHVQPKRSGKSNAALWTAQTVLALLFLFAGGMKLVVPIQALAAQSHLPGSFMKFIGLCETLGALGLILPGLTRIRVGLTPLAAAGLVIIMAGAVIVTVAQGTVGLAAVPFVVGSLCGFVSYRRWKVVPLRAAKLA